VNNDYMAFVKYPNHARWAFGAGACDLEGAIHRIVDHLEIYGTDPYCEAYVLSISERRSVLSVERFAATGDSIAVEMFYSLLKARGVKQ
jgi:hypothetical protein